MSTASPSFDFTTPVGRLVSGCAFEPQTTDQQGAPLLDKNNQPTKRWFMGVAFDKRNPEFQTWYQGLLAQAMRDWPHLFDAATGQCRLPTFSMKIIDGDGVDTTGRAWSEREGYAGHFVVRFTSGFAPTVYFKDKYDPMQRVTDPQALKRGYYVRIAGSARGNGNQQKPGMYCNLNLVEIYGMGPVIQGGPDATAAFGTVSAPAFIPEGMQDPGMIQTSLTPAGMAAPGMPGMVTGAPGMATGMPGMVTGAPGMATGMPGMVTGAPGMATPGMGIGNTVGTPQPGAAYAGMTGHSPSSVPTYVNHTSVGMPATPGITAPDGSAVIPDAGFVDHVDHVGAATAPQQPVMGPNAGQFTYEQWRATGQTDDQLRAIGVII